MRWRKSPQLLIDLFARVVPHAPDVERRQMFGYPAAFLNGNLFAGLHQESFILRLCEADRERARVELGAGGFEPMPGRRMREYVVVPEAALAERRGLAAWISRSVRYARSLPPKTSKTSVKPTPARPKRSAASRRPTAASAKTAAPRATTPHQRARRDTRATTKTRSPR